MIRLAAIFLLCFAVGFIGGQISAAEPENVLISRDTDLNGILESYHLVNKQLTVWEGRQMIWQTPAEWEIERILLADADNDGVDELLMVLWKHGSFGDVRPFWQSADRAYSCHLFMYRLQAGRMKRYGVLRPLTLPLLTSRHNRQCPAGISGNKERSTFPILPPLYLAMAGLGLRPGRC